MTFTVAGVVPVLLYFLWDHCAPPGYFENRITLKPVLITKTYLYNFDPLKPHFYIVKQGFTGYTLFFLFLLKSRDCGYS